MDTKTYIEIGTFLLLGVFSVAQFYNGKRSRKSNDITDAQGTIQLLKDRVDAQDARITQLQINLNIEHDKVIGLQTELKLKDQTIKEYLDILQNRNPELESFMKSTSSALVAIAGGIEKLLKAEQTITVTNK